MIIKLKYACFIESSQLNVIIKVNNFEIKSLNSMNVLGIVFDSKFNWNDHVAKAISKSNMALHCIRLVNSTSIRMNYLISLQPFSTQQFIMVLKYGTSLT